MNKKNSNIKEISPYILRNTSEMEYKIYGLLSNTKNIKAYTDREISDLCRFFINVKNYSGNDKMPSRLKEEALNRGVGFKNLLN